MFYIRIAVLSTCLGLLLLGTGCAVHRKFPVVQPVPREPRNAVSKMKAEEYFVKARDYDRRGIVQMAERFYELAYEFDPGSSVLQEELISKYIESSKFAQALLVVKGNRKLNELNHSQKRLVSTIYLKMGEFAKGADALEAIQDRNEEETYSLGLIYESMGNIPKAINRYLLYFKDHPGSPAMGLKIGKLLIREKRYEEAEKLLTDLQKKIGESPEIYSMLGAMKMVRRDTVTALELFGKALGIDSTHEETLRNLAQIYLGNNDYARTIPFYEKLYATSYYGDVYGRTLAVLYYYNNQYNEAQKLIEDLLKNTDDDFELHYYLGLVFSATNRSDNARIEMEKAIAIQKLYGEAWKELVYISAREKNFDQALDDAQRFTQAVPESPGSWRVLGYIHNLMKQYSKAVIALQKAIKYDTADSYLWYELGSSQERNGDIKGASKAFQKVLALRPGDASAANYLGYMWAEHKMNLDSAKTLLELALKKEPENGAYLDSYAWICYQMGNMEKAYEYMVKALSRLNSDPVVYSHYGDILNKQGNYREAIKAYAKSIELNADDADAIRKKIVELQTILKQDN